MLSCISIGITEYCNNQNLSPVPCAYSDAQNIYDALRAVTGSEFNSHLSICAKNITNNEFSNLLSVFCRSTGDTTPEEMTLVIYFSGHGLNPDGSFILPFANYSGKSFPHDDFTDIPSIQSALSSLKCNILLILDCCNSGLGTTDITGRTNITILSATKPIPAITSFSEGTGSSFATALYKSIMDFDSTHETFSLNALINKLEKNGYRNHYLNRAADQKLDMVFMQAHNLQQYTDFPELFLERINTGNRLSREALCYSLNDMPESLIIRVCQPYFRSGNHEASWLVRRAIGSTLSNHVANPTIKNRLINLTRSPVWQDQCIGLIGLRYLIKSNPDVRFQIVELIENNLLTRPDAVWLAALYLSEYNKSVEPVSVSLFQKTALMKSLWGLIELCKAFGLFSGDNHALDWFEDKVAPSDYQALLRERDLLQSPSPASHDLVHFIYSGKPRGRLPQNSKNKFLLSAVYGNWRDQIAVDLTPYLESHSHEEISSELKTLGKALNVERKMAVYSYFNMNRSMAEDYADSLLWGLHDPHPWVRRSAVEFYLEQFGSTSKYKEVLRESYLTATPDPVYPGILDFYLTTPQELRSKLLKKVRPSSVKGSLLPGDYRSIEQALRNE